MKSKMRIALFAMLALAAASLCAQQVKASAPAPTPAPKLSTADRLAISACEQNKKEARDKFDVSQQQELTIIQEWDAAHPGFYIDQQTFIVTPQKAADAPVAPNKGEASKAVPDSAKK